MVGVETLPPCKLLYPTLPTTLIYGGILGGIVQNLLILIILTFSFSCQKERVVEIIKSSNTNVEIDKTFEGYFFFKNQSYIELNENDRGDVQIGENSIILVNLIGNNLGTIPTVPGGKYPIHDNVLSFIIDLNYKNDHGIEEDTTGRKVVGKRATLFMFWLNDGCIRSRIIVYDGRVGKAFNKVVVERYLGESC